MFGYWTGRALEWALPDVRFALYRGLQFGIDWRVALFLALAGIVCAVLFSMPPAFASSRKDLNPAMKGHDARNSRQREMYSVAQVALSLALLIATGLLVRALQHVQSVDPGFAIDHRLYVNLSAPDQGADKQVSVLAFSNLVQQTRELPGVEDATLAWGVFPMAGEDCAGASRETMKKALTNTVDPNYFDLMGIPIVLGRGFVPGESPAAIPDVMVNQTMAPAAEKLRPPKVTPLPDVIVNQTMARTFWPGEDVIGKNVWLDGCPGDVPKQGTVIGVARDAKYAALAKNRRRFITSHAVRILEGNGFFSLIVRTAGNPRQWIKPVLDLLQRRAGDLRIYDNGALENAVALSLWEVKWQASLLGALGLLAIGLAAHRRIWRRGLLGGATHARNRRSHGSRSSAFGCAMDGIGARPPHYCDGDRGGVVAQRLHGPPAARISIRSESVRPDRVRCRQLDMDRHRHARQLVSGAPRHSRRPHDGVELRMMLGWETSRGAASLDKLKHVPQCVARKHSALDRSESAA